MPVWLLYTAEGAAHVSVSQESEDDVVSSLDSKMQRSEEAKRMHGDAKRIP